MKRESHNQPNPTPYTSRITKEEWVKGGKAEPAESVRLALEMQKGNYLRISHPDVFCDGHQCGLRSALSKKKGKWRFKHTHPGEALILREK